MERLFELVARNNEKRRTPKPTVVIVGGGFGGLYATRRLRGVDVNVVLIDKRNFHLFQPLLYQVATGGLSPANIASPLRSILSRQRNVEVILGEVVDFDLENRQVVLKEMLASHENADENGELISPSTEHSASQDRGEMTVNYDELIVAAGACNSYFGNAKWQSVSPGLKTIEDATAIRCKILSAFEMAEVETNHKVREGWLTFVIVGGGPTGVELAGAIAEIARYTLSREFRRIDPQEAKVKLIDAEDSILKSFPDSLAQKAARSLADLGVEILTSTHVNEIENDRVVVQHKNRTDTINASSVFWAAGVKANPLTERLSKLSGCEIDRSGRLKVNPDLSLAQYKNVFVIGDMVHIRDRNGDLVPGVAPAAIQQGKYVAKRISRRRRNRSVNDPFVYRDLGNLATIGRSRAIADFGRIRISGRIAWLLWLFVHLMQIVKHENRVLIFCQWAWNYFTFGRSARLITGPQTEDTQYESRQAQQGT